MAVEAPGVDGPAAAYWQGAAAGRLVLQQCADCGRIRHYPRVLCDNCYSFAVRPVEATGRGTVHSWTVAHHAFSPEFAADLPYVLLVVDMEEGVRVMGRLQGDVRPRIGLPVRVTFAPGLDGVPVPHFTADEAGES